MSSMPAATNTSASPTFAQQMPTAPRSICHRATTGDLWVLACGRSRTPGGVGEVLHAIDVGEEAPLVDDDRGRGEVGEIW